MSKLTKIGEWTDYVTFVPGNKGLAIDEKMPMEAWTSAVEAIGAVAADSLWALGDLFTFGERVYGEEYAQVFDEMKYSEKTVKDSTWVCGVFPASRRHKALTFNHHKIVAGLEPKDREILLAQAEKAQMSTRELTELKKQAFPSTKKPGKAKKKAETASEGGDDAETLPEATPAPKMTLPDGLAALNLAVSFFEQQDPKVKFTPEFTKQLGDALNALRRQARRYGYFGGNR